MTANKPPGSSWRKRVPAATILILVLAAFAGITYYLGTPAPTPDVIPMTNCGGDPAIVITTSQNFQPPSLNLVIGTNNTVAWIDDYSGSGALVFSTDSPTGGPQWDLNMTDTSGANTECIALTVPGTYIYAISTSQYQIPGMVTVRGNVST